MNRILATAIAASIVTVTAAEDRVKQLERRWRGETARGAPNTYPPFDWDDLTDGNWGFADSGMRSKNSRNEEQWVTITILKRLDEAHRALIAVETSSQTWKRSRRFPMGFDSLHNHRNTTIVLADGFQFGSKVEGNIWRPYATIEVSGDYEYDSPTGKQTVKVIRPIALPPLPKTGHGFGLRWRTWTSSNGKHTVEARYLRYKHGIVHLMKKNLREIEVPMTELSAADRQYVRYRIKNDIIIDGNDFK